MVKAELGEESAEPFHFYMVAADVNAAEQCDVSGHAAKPSSNPENIHAGRAVIGA
jgi:hypothetical protein